MSKIIEQGLGRTKFFFIEYIPNRKNLDSSHKQISDTVTGERTNNRTGKIFIPQHFLYLEVGGDSLGYTTKNLQLEEEHKGPIQIF